MAISCDNIDPSLVIDTCGKDSSSLASLFHNDELTNCIPKDASFFCLHEKSVQEREDPKVQCQCLENTSTGAYRLICVDTSCLKCNEQFGFCGFPTAETDFQPDGDTTVASYEGFFVYEGRAPSSMSAEDVARTMGPLSCSEMKDPHDACLQAREEVMSQDSVTVCDCIESSDGDSGYDLVCNVLPSCEYCDETGAVCASPSHSQKINQFGYPVGYSYYTFAYTTGREDVVAVEYESDECTVLINGEPCTSCQRVTCYADSFTAQDATVAAAAASSTTRRSGNNDLSVFWELAVDCSNVVENATFTCGGPTADGDGLDDDWNVLAVLGWSSAAADLGCWDNETAAPVEQELFDIPLSPPSEGNTTTMATTTATTAIENDEMDASWSGALTIGPSLAVSATAALILYVF
jgi:hypothetical protein